MNGYLMALDQGTTSSRCILFDRKGGVAAQAQKEFAQHFPQPGWVEHDAMEIWSSQIAVAHEAMERMGLEAGQIAAVGVTNQRETVVVWDKDTGEPACPAIVWQCRRTAGECDRFKAEAGDWIRRKTGLTVDSYFSATKLKWILDNVPGARGKAEAGRLLFGTVDSWLVWKLTRGKAHVTDVTNASRTMLFDIHKGCWDEDLLHLFGIPRCMLPQVRPSSHILGYTDKSLFGREIPIGAAAGDQQAALFGQMCFDEGMCKNTYGTGGFLLMNTGIRPVESANGLLTTVAWDIGQGLQYALEGSIFVAGAAVQWLRDGLQIIKDAPSSERLALEVADTGGVYLVPAFVGLGAPYWDPYARGLLVGLTRGTGRSHIVRATLESLCYQTWDVIKAMEEDFGRPLSVLKADGGASGNRFVMQFQADILGVEVSRPACVETTARGAALMAGLAVGYYGSLSEIVSLGGERQVFTPQMEADRRERLLDGWHEAVQRSRGWARPKTDK